MTSSMQIPESENTSSTTTRLGSPRDSNTWMLGRILNAAAPGQVCRGRSYAPTNAAAAKDGTREGEFRHAYENDGPRNLAA